MGPTVYPITNYQLLVITRMRGFTLTELMVSIAIFALLTTVTVAAYRSGDDQTELRHASDLLANILRDAQARSRAGRVTSVCPGAGAACSASCAVPCADEFPAAGYGVHVGVGEGTARMFADLGAAPNRLRDLAEDMETVPLARSGLVTVVVMAEKNPAGDGNPSVGDVVFIPPQPATRINARSEVTELRITLRHSRTGAERTVTVNAVSGLVSE